MFNQNKIMFNCMNMNKVYLKQTNINFMSFSLLFSIIHEYQIIEPENFYKLVGTEYNIITFDNNVQYIRSFGVNYSTLIILCCCGMCEKHDNIQIINIDKVTDVYSLNTHNALKLINILNDKYDQYLYHIYNNVYFEKHKNNSIVDYETKKFVFEHNKFNITYEYIGIENCILCFYASITDNYHATYICMFPLFLVLSKMATLGKIYYMIVRKEFASMYYELFDIFGINRMFLIFCDDLESTCSYYITNLYNYSLPDRVSELYPPITKIFNELLKNYFNIKYRHHQYNRTNLYITRDGHRNIINKNEMIDMLSMYNFRVVTCENLSLEKKYLAISGYNNIVICETGANMANLYFSKQNIDDRLTIFITNEYNYYEHGIFKQQIRHIGGLTRELKDKERGILKSYEYEIEKMNEFKTFLGKCVNPVQTNSDYKINCDLLELQITKKCENIKILGIILWIEKCGVSDSQKLINLFFDNKINDVFMGVLGENKKYHNNTNTELHILNNEKMGKNILEIINTYSAENYIMILPHICFETTGEISNIIHKLNYYDIIVVLHKIKKNQYGKVIQINMYNDEVQDIAYKNTQCTYMYSLSVMGWNKIINHIFDITDVTISCILNKAMLEKIKIGCIVSRFTCNCE